MSSDFLSSADWAQLGGFHLGASLAVVLRWWPELEFRGYSDGSSYTIMSVTPAGKAGRAGDQPGSCLPPLPLYVDFLQAWWSRVSQTSYMGPGYLQMHHPGDPGRSFKAF